MHKPLAGYTTCPTALREALELYRVACLQLPAADNVDLETFKKSKTIVLVRARHAKAVGTGSD